MTRRARVRQGQCTGLAAFLRIFSVFILTLGSTEGGRKTEKEERNERGNQMNHGQPPLKVLPDQHGNKVDTSTSQGRTIVGKRTELCREAALSLTRKDQAPTILLLHWAE